MFVSHPHCQSSSWFHLFYLIFTLWCSFLVGLHMSIISILWCMFGFTFITIPRFFHLVRLLFVHLLLMSVDIWLDFTFVRAFFTFVLSQVFNCRKLVSSFVIVQWHLSNHICAAFITRIWQELPQWCFCHTQWRDVWSSLFQYLLPTGERYDENQFLTFTLNLQICKFSHFLVRSIVQLQT